MKMMSGCKGEVKDRGLNLGATHIYLVFKAMGLDKTSRMGDWGGGGGQVEEWRGGGRGQRVRMD